MEETKAKLMNTTSNSLGRMENDKKETLRFEQKRSMNQTRQQIFQQALGGARGALKNSFQNRELHFRIIRATIGILAVEEITNWTVGGRNN